MKKLILALFASSAVALFATEAQAATYNFNMLYNGTAVLLQPGSDVPNGTVLNVGDTFNINLQAAGTGFWHVNAPYNVFVPLSFLVNESATRTANINTDFSNNGAIVNTITDTGIGQAKFHVGAQVWNLASGLDFDQVALTWSLLAINTAGPSTINAGFGFFNGFGQVDAPFFNSPKISFSVSSVPLPAALPLLVTAIAGVFGASRRRKNKAA